MVPRSVGDSRNSDDVKHQRYEKKVKKKSDASAAATFALSSGRTHVGMKLLGTVREVFEHHLVINLPNQLTGTVRSSDAIGSTGNDDSSGDDDGKSGSDSDEEEEDTAGQAESLADMFAEGQMVACDVIEIDTSGIKSHIRLSLDPAQVNSDMQTLGLIEGP